MIKYPAVRDYFEKYLKVAPFSLALWRSLEANLLARAQKRVGFGRPILDLGCGFGEFAGVFFDRSLEVGVDIAADDLSQAAVTRKYKKVHVEDARRLSFKSKTFATVISISVLEHIPKVHLAVREAYRVLKPGGYFVVTMPTNEFYSNLLYTSWLEKLGLEKLAHRYYRLLNKAFRHVNLWPESRWLKSLRQAGFQIVYTQKHISSAATKVFDLFLVTALPSQIGRWITGERWVGGYRWKRKLLGPLFNYLKNKEDETGSNLLIVAKKS